jgi:hypothetical protein
MQLPKLGVARLKVAYPSMENPVGMTSLLSAEVDLAAGKLAKTEVDLATREPSTAEAHITAGEFDISEVDHAAGKLGAGEQDCATRKLSLAEVAPVKENAGEIKIQALPGHSRAMS